MNINILFSIIIFIWVGMILGISCLEAWVKFKTPSLTKLVGLDVGRTVFRAFHKVQWLLTTMLWLAFIFTPLQTTELIILLSLTILLSSQTFWLFPALCANIDLIISGNNPAKPLYHSLYALIEFIKLLLLFISGIFSILHQLFL